MRSIVSLKRILKTYGWRCKKVSKVEYRFYKAGENTILVSTEPDNEMCLNVTALLNMISGEMRAVIAMAANSFQDGFDLYVKPGSATSA